MCSFRCNEVSLWKLSLVRSKNQPRAGKCSLLFLESAVRQAFCFWCSGKEATMWSWWYWSFFFPSIQHWYTYQCCTCQKKNCASGETRDVEAEIPRDKQAEWMRVPWLFWGSENGRSPSSSLQPKSRFIAGGYMGWSGIPSCANACKWGGVLFLVSELCALLHRVLRVWGEKVLPLWEKLMTCTDLSTRKNEEQS